MTRQGSALSVLIMLLAVTTTGCLGACDIFNASQTKLAGAYCLERDREFTAYRVQKCAGPRDTKADGVGLFDGTVERIGWNEQHILAWRKPAFGGDSAGWMLLEVSTGRVEGPFDEAQLRNLRDERQDLQGIVTRPVAEVLP
jgi:hypothetical protein